MAVQQHAPAHDPNFSLGQALFGSAPLQAPDPWRLSLLHDSMDAASRLAVFQLCTASRDWVRQTAKQATLRLRLNGTTPQVAAMLSAARQALTTRGQLPTKVVLQQSEADESALFMVPGMLHGLPITDLRLELLHLHSYNTCTSFLTALATALTALRTLDIHQLEGSLPNPALLRNLTQLSFLFHDVLDNTDAICASIAALMPQLTHFNANTDLSQALEVLWGQLITAACPRLTHLTTTDYMDDRLLTPLLQHAPAVTYLTVQSVCIEAGVSFAQQRWALECLDHQETVLEVVMLARLPSHPGTLKVHVGPKDKQQGLLTFSVCSKQGLDESVVGRLPTWVLSGVESADLHLDVAMPPEDQPAALAASLQQLRGLQSSNREVWLAGWHWAPATVQVVEQAMTAGYPFKLCMQCGALTTELADTLVQHAPSVVDVAVSHLELDPGYQPPVPCKWQEVTVCDKADMSDFVTLPPTTEPLTLSFQSKAEVTFELPAQGWEELVDQLTTCLARLVINNADPTPFILNLQSEEHYNSPQQLSIFRQYLKVLHAMRAKPGAARLNLGFWKMTLDMVAELAALPSWSDTVRFWSLDWVPDEPLLCAQLASAIPRHYTTWEVRDMTDVQLVDVCMGLAKRGPPADEQHKLMLKVMREDDPTVIDEERAAFLRPYLRFLGADGWVEVASQ